MIIQNFDTAFLIIAISASEFDAYDRHKWRGLTRCQLNTVLGVSLLLRESCVT